MSKLNKYNCQAIDKKDIKEVVQVLESDIITGGTKVSTFEFKLSAYTGAIYTVAVNSATSALSLAVNALNLPKGSEIIVPAFTFVATANCVLHNGHEVEFADVDKDTFCISVDSIKSKITSKTKAIICVDYAGCPCDMDKIMRLAKTYNLYVIHDASHSLGAIYKNKKVGCLADITVFSFHAVKPITTGEGGACLTNNEELYNRIKSLRSHGISYDYFERKDWRYDVTCLGYNYRMTEFQASLGISQLDKLETFINKRQLLFERYKTLLKGIVTFQNEPEYVTRHGRHLLPVLFVSKEQRDYVYEYLRKEGIGVNVHYIPIYMFSYYVNLGYSEPLVNVEDIFTRVLSIPLHYNLELKEVDKICLLIKKAIKEGLNDKVKIK